MTDVEDEKEVRKWEVTVVSSLCGRHSERALKNFEIENKPISEVKNL
jgi:hypothetical protein